MVLLDAYALIAFVTGGAAESGVRSLLRAGPTGVATANLIEVLDKLERVRGVPRDRAWAVLEPLLEGTITPIPLDVEIARRAAWLRAAHYHRQRRPLSLADCVLLASGAPGDGIATADTHVLEVAAAEDLKPIPLPRDTA